MSIKRWIRVGIIPLVGCIGMFLYAKEYVDMDYRQLYPKMSPVAVKATLNWKQIPNSVLWKDETVRRKLSFLTPERTLVFAAQEPDTKGNMMVVELDGDHLLKQVFLVFESGKSKDVEFLWPERGEYEHYFRNIKVGDDIESLMGKIGWRPPAYYGKNKKGEDIVFYVYEVRETTVYLGVNKHSGKIESLMTFIDADVMVVIDGETIGEPKEWFAPPHLPLPEIEMPKDVDVEYPIDF